MNKIDVPKMNDHIRALGRGLEVIELLSQKGQMSLADLRHATGLPNPSLLRILSTLQHRKWVRRSIVEGRYELNHSLGAPLGENARAHPLAEYAGPILANLKARQAGWPSDLCAVLEPGRIEIIESTRLRGPMAPTRTALGIRPSMVLSAHGRATLAFSSPQIVNRHLDVLKKNGSKEDRNWIASGQLDAEIKATNKRGFGLRESQYWAAPFDPGDELGAIAIPIISKSGMHGTISLLWLVDDINLTEVLALGTLENLRNASAKIGAALDHAGVNAQLN